MSFRVTQPLSVALVDQISLSVAIPGYLNVHVFDIPCLP